MPTLGGEGGGYTLTGHNLTLHLHGAEVSYQFDLVGHGLTLSGGDLAKPLTFTSQPEVTSFLEEFAGMSWGALMRKLYRILIIAGTVVVSIGMVKLLRGLSRLIVYTDWWPFRLSTASTRIGS